MPPERTARRAPPSTAAGTHSAADEASPRRRSIVDTGALLAFPNRMYAGGSIFLIAIGAILYWAVTYRVPGVNLPMVGLILMVVGVIGLLFSLIGAATHRRHIV